MVTYCSNLASFQKNGQQQHTLSSKKSACKVFCRILGIFTPFLVLKMLIWGHQNPRCQIKDLTILIGPIFISGYLGLNRALY